MRIMRRGATPCVRRMPRTTAFTRSSDFRNAFSFTVLSKMRLRSSASLIPSASARSRNSFSRISSGKRISFGASAWGDFDRDGYPDLVMLNGPQDKRGIVGNPINRHDSPFGLSEEFVEVYRLHSLLPETLQLRRRGQDGIAEEVPFPATRQRGATGRSGR